MLIRHAVFLLATLAAARPAAARHEFFAKVNGERLAGSRVCFSPAGDESRYFSKFMGDGTEVLCLSTDDVIDLPVGAWNFFAFHESGYVSVHPEHVTIYKTTDRYVPVEMDLVPAGILDLTRLVANLPSSDEAVVYFSNAGYPQSPSAIRRLLPEQTRMLVPAGSEVLPLVIRAGVPVLVGNPVVVAAGEVKRVDPITEATTVVVPIQLALTDELWRSGGIVDPVISARTDDGQAVKNILSLRTGTALERSLVVLRPPKAGPLHIRLEGARWRPAELGVEAASGRVAVSDWLRGVPASEVDLTWELSPDAITVRSRNAACKNTVEPAVVRLLRCDRGPSHQCVVVKEVSAALHAGSLHAASLEPGDYAAEFTFPPFPGRRTPFTIAPAEHREIDEEIGGTTIHGQITRGESFVAAATVDIDGIVVATSELDGSYAIPVDTELGIVPVQVRACDESFSFTTVPAAPVPAGATFDIHIPDNRLEISVVDAKNRKPIAGANVTVVAVHPADPESAVFTTDAKADERGVVSVGPLMTTLPIRACAQLAGYRQACSTPGRIAPSGEKRDRLELTPYAREGRIVVSGRLVAGSAFWVGRDGVVREAIYDIRPDDGAFWFDYAPMPGDYLVVVSQSHPLMVYRPRSFETLVVRIPPASTPIVVDVAQSYHRPVAAPTIAIGGYLVPAEVFAQHARWRRLGDFHRGATYEIRDIVMDGPLTVLLGPAFRDRPLDLPPAADIFVLPQYSGLVDRRALGQDGRVTFE